VLGDYEKKYGAHGYIAILDLEESRFSEIYASW
jgi:hypothetical protein